MEETMTTQEQATETTDAFLDGWGEPGDSETAADQPQEEGAAEDAKEQTDSGADGEAQEAGNDQQDAAAHDGGQEQAREAEGAPQGQEKDTAPQTWTLRHLNETRTVNEQEMTALAQKGLDYDRVRKSYDEFKPVMDLFSQFANKAGMNTQDYIAYIRQEAKKAEGMNAADAKRAVELEDREATVAAREAEEAERQRQEQEAKAGKDAEDARRMADIQEFQKTFPDAAKDPKSIPKEVWDGVRGGLSLVASYAKWRVNQAQAEAQKAAHDAGAAQQNRKNAERSTGSMKSAGEENKSKDPFLQGWDS